MADTRRRLTSLGITLALLGANLVAFNLLLAAWRAPRLDLTADRRYSISAATQRLLGGLDEEVTVYGFFSARTHPKLAPLVPQIADLLEEYRALSRGRVRVEIVDPREDEELGREATERYGVQSTPFRLASKYETGIVNAFFSVVVKYGDQYVRYGFDDLIEIEPLPDGDVDVRLRNLEYDLTRAIKKVVYGFRGTAELFERVEQPMRLTAVITPERLPELFRGVPEALRAAAAELETKGGDKFEYVELDPSRGPDVEQQVSERYGARPMSLGLLGQETFYLYGFLESGASIEQLALTGEQLGAAEIREAVESALRRLTPGFLTTVGLVTPEPEIPPEILMQLQMQGRMPPQPPPEFEELRQFLGRDYQVRPVRLDSSEGVPAAVDILMLVKPTRLGEREVYHLDQYLMRGGRVVICSGNYDAKFGGEGLDVSPLDSGLDAWLAHFGVDVENTLLLDDRNQPLPIPETQMTPLGMLRTWRMAPYPYLVEVRDEGFRNREITARLGGVGIYWGSPLTVNRETAKDLEVVEILQSSPRSWTSDDLSRVGYVDYEVPSAGLAPRLVAAALRGSFGSFYAGKSAPEGTPGVPLTKSPETRLAVVGNAAFLSDFVARALGTGDSGFFVENLAFTQNLIDWMSLDNDLIGIRSRATGVRRLERVERHEELTIEIVNYLLPLGALLALGGVCLWRRRSTRPAVERRAEG